MIIKAELTIDIGTYENIKPQIEIDTDDLDNSLELVNQLWDKFHKCMDKRSVKPVTDSGKDDILDL